MTTLLRVLTHRASLPLWCGVLLLLSVPPSWGQQELRSGKKGATDGAPITSTSIDANTQALDVNVVGGSLGNVTIENTDGAIVDGANNTIKATVLDLTNSNPVTVGIVDANGDQITSFGGGTQYQQGTASTTTDTMTMAGCVRVDTPAVATGVIDGDRARCMVDSIGRLWVHVGVVDGTISALQSGSWNVGQTGTWTVQPGNTANTTPWLFSISQGGNTAAVNASSQLSVNCANCSGSGVSQQDNTGFTPGTTNFVPMGGEVDDTGTTAVTENNAGVARITAQRAVHTNLRNNSGTEIGTSGAPIRTDPTGSTTQPVSGTVTANAGTGTFFDGIIKDGTGDTTQANVSNGRLQVENYNANLAADNSTLSTQKVPVLPGTVSTSAPTWTNGNQSALSLQTDGSVRAAITNTPTVTANAGTNLNTSALLTTSAHDAAFGTAGTADTQVRTIQGIAGMTAVKVDGSAVTQPVSGTITANAGTGSFTVAQATGTNLHVVCDSGCSSSSGFADNGAFTFGTTAINPIGGVFDDTSPNTATENSAAIARITQNKALHMNLRNASGTEIGTSSNAVRTDPTGTTPQPATQSGTWTVQPGNTANTTAWLMKTADPCTSGTKVFLPISQATSTQLLTGTASNRTYVCSIVVTQPSASTQTFSLVNGTGTVCATSTAAMMGATTAANGMQLPFSHGSGSASVAKSTVNADNVCLLQSSTDRIAGVLSYVVAP